METQNVVVGLPKFFPLVEFVEDVYLENIIRNPLNMENHGEHKTSWIWFIVISIASIYLRGCKVLFDLY
jgi:hypothetical protein